MTISLNQIALLFMLIGYYTNSYATEMSTPINIQGTLIKSSGCDVAHENGLLHLDFRQDMQSSMIDGLNYEEVLNYTIRCVSDDVATLQYRIRGDMASFDHNLIKTSKDNLAIRFALNFGKYQINRDVSYTMKLSNPPRLSATPAKAPGSVISSVVFDAVAFLEVSYP